jgi:hypothetical protein
MAYPSYSSILLLLLLFVVSYFTSTKALFAGEEVDDIEENSGRNLRIRKTHFPTTQPPTFEPTAAPVAPVGSTNHHGEYEEYEYETPPPTIHYANLGEDCSTNPCLNPYTCSNTFSVCFDAEACSATCKKRKTKSSCTGPVSNSPGCACVYNKARHCVASE